MIRGFAALLAASVVLAPSLGAAEDGAVHLHAAGSLRAALTEVARAFTARHGVQVKATFGASGLLRRRLEQGGAGDVFASADMGNPLALERAGKAGPVVFFARNRLCALARPGLPITPDTLLDRMLDPAVKLGTSTPGADPAGDYAWEVFRKADAVRPGSRARLEAKALRLTGGPDAAVPPPGLGPYAWNVREGRADVFLTYCTGAQAAAEGLKGAQLVELPPALATDAAYGLTILDGANTRAASLALFVLSADGQTILARHGFTAPLLP